MKTIHESRYIDLIERMRVLREERNVTQTELAAKLGKHQSYVAKVENLERRLDIIEFADWLKALNQDPGLFLGTLAWWPSS